MIQYATAEARRWLLTFFPPPRRQGLLPQRICRWLTSAEARRPTGTLVVNAQRESLFIHRHKPEFKSAIVLVIERIRGHRLDRSRKHGRLTHRESEVLHWLRQGKSDAEIGQILGISPRTVSKHLERIYQKLGVDSRTAAAASHG